MKKVIFFVSLFFISVSFGTEITYEEQEIKNFEFLKRCYTEKGITTRQKLKKYLETEYQYRIDNQNPSIDEMLHIKEVYTKNVDNTCFIDYMYWGFFYKDIKERFEEMEGLDFFDHEEELRQYGPKLVSKISYDIRKFKENEKNNQRKIDSL